MLKRETIDIPGVTHGSAPIPMGAKVGSIVYSSAIMGKDSQTNELPMDAEGQMSCLFRNIATFMNEAGGSINSIVRMSVYLKDNSFRVLLNKEWKNMFPDEKDRPARHVSIQKDLQKGMVVQVELVAVL